MASQSSMRDDLGVHGEGRQHRVDVLLDEAGDDDLVGEGVVDLASLPTAASTSARVPTATKFPSCTATAWARGLLRVHGDELAGDVDRRAAGAWKASAGEVLSELV